MYRLDYREWTYILIAVVFVMILFLYFILKRFSRTSDTENAVVKENRETPKHSNFSGVELRANFRVNLNDVPCFVEFLDVDNEELNPKFFNAVLKNISVGGVKFDCDHEYPIEDDMMIKVRFSLKDSMFILKGRIVRKELYLDRKRFGYGVQFTSLLDEDKELLFHILNRIMVEKRRDKVANSFVGGESVV